MADDLSDIDALFGGAQSPAPSSGPQSDTSQSAPLAGEMHPLTVHAKDRPIPKTDDLSDIDAAFGNGAAAAGPPQDGYSLANSGDDGFWSSAGKSVGTAAIKGLSNSVGTVGNLGNFADYLVARGEHLFTGKPVENILQEMQAQRAKQQSESLFPAWLNPRNVFPSGEQVAAPILAKTGEYVPASEPGKMAQSGLETAFGMVGPGAGAKVPSASLAQALVKAPIAAAPANFTAGSVGQGVTDATGDPLLGMLAGSALPAAKTAAVKAIAPYIKPYTDPLFSTKRQDIADQRLLASSSNPEKAISDIAFQPNELVPGSRPTTGELTGDTGLLQAQKAAAVEHPAFRADLFEKEGAQNVARRGAIDATAPVEANQMAPSRLLQAHLDHIDQATQMAVDRLSRHADTLNSGIPNATNPEASGAQLRNSVAHVGEAARQEKSRLYQAVDPDGKLAVVTKSVADGAADMQRSFDPNVSLQSKFAAPIVKMAAALPEVAPFNKLVSLDQTISSQMSQAMRAGDYAGHAQLVRLKGLVKSVINNAIDNQHAWEQAAVERGEIAPENTIGAALQQEANVFSAKSQATARTNAGTGNGAILPTGTPAVSPASRTKVQGGRGPGNAPGDQGLQRPNLEPNADPEAAQRIAAANAAHANYAQIYRQGPVGDILKTNGYAGQYTVPNSAVMARAIPVGDRGYQATRAFLRASDNSPEAISAMQDMAVTRLREIMRGQDRVTPTILNSWRQKYAQSLRAINEVSPGFSNQFNNAGRATEIVAQAQAARDAALADAQRGAAGKFMGMTHPDEVKAQVGKMLAANDGPTQITTLLNRIGDNSEALDGLRRAGIEHMMERFSNAGRAGGEKVLSGAKLGAFLDKNQGALEALYGRDGLSTMRLVAADQARFQRAVDAVRVKGGSDTGQNAIPVLKKMAESSHGPSVGTAMLFGGMEAVSEGNLKLAAGVAALAGLKSYFGGKLSHGSEAVNKLYLEGLLNPEIGRAMLQRAYDKNGLPKESSLVNLSAAISRARAAEPVLREKQERASGGRITRAA